MYKYKAGDEIIYKRGYIYTILGVTTKHYRVELSNGTGSVLNLSRLYVDNERNFKMKQSIGW